MTAPVTAGAEGDEREMEYYADELRAQVAEMLRRRDIPTDTGTAMLRALRGKHCGTLGREFRAFRDCEGAPMILRLVDAARMDARRTGTGR